MDSGSALQAQQSQGSRGGKKGRETAQHLYASTSISMAVGSRPCANSARLLSHTINKNKTTGKRREKYLQSSTKYFMLECTVPHTPATSRASSDMQSMPSQLANS